MSDTYGFFNPIAFPWNNSTNPSPSSLFPTSGASGIASTPSGMLGSTFGSPFANIPPNKAPAITNPMNPGGGPAPALPTPVNVGMAPGAANPSVPSASPVTPGSAWDTINNNLGKMTSNPNFAKSVQSLQSILSGQNQPKMQPAQFSPIQMAQPQGGGGQAPATNPWLNALRAKVGGMMGTPQAQQAQGILSPYMGMGG